ncbi:MAG: GNAT family N-acetyltransferase [Euryarchaeota archaeon]|nr:GNAT family N-acetyltransferase [Euryarchaeota archaeon]
MRPSPVPASLWAEFRQDMVQAHPEGGAREVKGTRAELGRGRLRTQLLASSEGTPCGFALHRPLRYGARQVETFYLLRTFRSPRALAAELRRFLAASRVATLRVDPLVASPAALTGILRPLGFERFVRRRLFIDPRRVRGPLHLPTGFGVRALCRKDLEVLPGLWARAYARHLDEAFVPGGSSRAFSRWYVRFIFERKQPRLDLSCSFVIERRGRLIGDVLTTRDARASYIQDVAVDPAYRQRGFGSVLLRTALSTLASRGERRVEIGVTVQNPTGAYAIYRHLGFHQVTGRKRDAGLWVNARERGRLGWRALRSRRP